MDKQILIIDIETTGFSHSKDMICEIGIVSLHIETGEKKILFDKVCREDHIKDIDLEKAWIVENGFMTVEEIEESLNLKQYLPEIQYFIGAFEYGATAYNNVFDFGFLEDRGIKFGKKLGCPMKLSREICKIKGKKGIKNPSVQEAWDFYFGDTGYVEKHRGADDAMHEAEIVFELIKGGHYKF